MLSFAILLYILTLKWNKKWNKTGYGGRIYGTYTATIRIKGTPSLARTFDTKGEAKQWAADIETKVRAGRYQDTRSTEKLLFVDVLDRYIEQISTTKRPNSERRDRDSAKALLAGFGEETLFTNIDTQRIAAYRDSRIRQVSPSTIQKEFALLSHLFNIARREWGLPVENPV